MFSLYACSVCGDYTDSRGDTEQLYSILRNRYLFQVSQTAIS